MGISHDHHLFTSRDRLAVDRTRAIAASDVITGIDDLANVVDPDRNADLSDRADDGLVDEVGFATQQKTSNEDESKPAGDKAGDDRQDQCNHATEAAKQSQSYCSKDDQKSEDRGQIDWRDAGPSRGAAQSTRGEMGMPQVGKMDRAVVANAKDKAQDGRRGAEPEARREKIGQNIWAHRIQPLQRGPFPARILLSLAPCFNSFETEAD